MVLDGAQEHCMSTRFLTTKNTALVIVLALAWGCSSQSAPPAPAQAAAQQPAPGPRPVPTSGVGATRIEKDLLGEKAIPADAYYGVQTARALENFQISGVPINHYPGFVEAWAIVKLASARANTDVGAMKKETLGGHREGH